ncbi:hypothetical protein ACIGGF_01320 [Rhodococcus sp. NPDC078407]|uniref:hypothetical protein n=1 Tax=Rhodococcus sp. NPDC078407 TaxID=3364509 RepID=UPI0037C83B9D
MTPTDSSSAQTVMGTSVPETSLLETQWAGRVVASAFVLLSAGLSWVFAATAMIG